jgi:hypothetical protein
MTIADSPPSDIYDDSRFSSLIHIWRADIYIYVWGRRTGYRHICLREENRLSSYMSEGGESAIVIYVWGRRIVYRHICLREENRLSSYMSEGGESSIVIYVWGRRIGYRHICLREENRLSSYMSEGGESAIVIYVWGRRTRPQTYMTIAASPPSDIYDDSRFSSLRHIWR